MCKQGLKLAFIIHAFVIVTLASIMHCITCYSLYTEICVFIVDADFHIQNIMQALKKLKAWEEFYYTVTGSHIYDDFPDFKDVVRDREMSLKTFMRKRPGKICWVDLAVAAYQCGEEKIFHQLSEKMKSPAGIYMLPIF